MADMYQTTVGTAVISTGTGAAITTDTEAADTFTAPVGYGIKAIGCGLAGNAYPLTGNARHIWRAFVIRVAPKSAGGGLLRRDARQRQTHTHFP